MNRGPDALGQLAAQIFPLRSILIFLACAALFFAAGCKKKSAPAVQRGDPRTSRVNLYLPRETPAADAPKWACGPSTLRASRAKPQALVADHIYITVPLTKSGAPDRAAHDAIEAELARVAEFHHLQRVARPGAPGLERFDYLMDGRRTQSIHLITPSAKTRKLRPQRQDARDLPS